MTGYRPGSEEAFTHSDEDGNGCRLCGGESIDNLVHTVGQRVQNADEFNLTFSDVQTRGEIACHVHVHEAYVIRELGTRNYCAQFNRLNFIGPDKMGERDWHPDSQRLGVRVLEASAGNCDGREQAMLVPVIEITQQTEERWGVGRPIGARHRFIRLIPLDYCGIVRGEISNARSLTLPQALRIGDGKRQPPRILDLALLETQREVEDEVIERGTEIVDAVTKLEAGALYDAGKVGHVTDIDDVLARLFIILSSHPWEIVSFGERRSNLGFESTVLSGPLDLGPHTLE